MCLKGEPRGGQVRSIKIILAGNPNEGEQGVAPGIGQRSSHPVRGAGFGDRAHRPIGGDPFAGGVDERGGEPDQATVAVDRCRLHCCDFVLAEAFADKIEAGGERRIAKGPTGFAREGRYDRRG